MRKRLLVFLKNKPNGEKEVFSRGNIIYKGKDLIQTAGDDGVEWSEVRLIEYLKHQSYSDDINEFDKEKNKVEKYKVILLKPRSKFKRFKFKLQQRIRNLVLSDDDDTSIQINKKESPSKKMKRTAGAAPNWAGFNKLLKKDRNLPMAMINLIKYRDIALYPEGYNGKPISGKKAYYKSTLFNNSEEDPDWDTMVILNYVSVSSFFNYASTKVVIKKGHIHREAGLEKTNIYSAFPYN
jgi:hypothetical protein